MMSAMTGSKNSPDFPLLQVDNLKMHFPVKKGFFRKTSGCIRAVDGLDFSIQREIGRAHV
jgi:ABC-type oligopeptide transport system ATPase subunit